MDVSRLSALLVVLYATLCTLTSAMSLPSSQLKDNPDQLESSDDNSLDEGRRASWLETRDLENDFKSLVLLTLQELVQEGRIDPHVVAEEPMVGDAKEKRGRWQGFCFRRTKSGRFLPYICWKGGQYDKKSRVQGVIDQKASRSRRQGFCFRRTKSGRFLPYICWKGDRK